MRKSLEKLDVIKIVKLLVIFLFIILVAVQANKKFVLDEIDFPIVSKATSETLKPIYYRGEQFPNHIGLYHPTLYINSLALFIKFFGYNEISVRLFGLTCTLITAYLLILIFRLFRERGPGGEALFLGLFLLNPYTIANTTLPDIDSTVLPVLFVAFIYLSLKYIWKDKRSDYFVIYSLGILFAINLWAKLTTPLVLPVFIFILMLIIKTSSKEALIKTLKVTIVGIFAFAVSYFLYCAVFSLPFNYTFSFLIQSFLKGTANNLSLMQKIINNFSNIKSFVYWITIPLLTVYFISLMYLFSDKNKDEETKIIKLLAALSLFVLVFYLCLISPFGGFFKYPFPIYGLAILIIVIFYQKISSKIRIIPMFTALLITAGFLLENYTFKDSMFMERAIFNGVPLIFLASLVVLFLLRFEKTASYLKYSIACLLFLAFGWQISISRAQAISSYPTKYNYGQRGLDDTINYLKVKTTKDEVIWSMKDVGYYVHNKYIENYGYFFDPKLNEELEELLNEGKVKYYVVTIGIGEDRVDIPSKTRDILEYNTVREAEFGNFIIYRAKK